MIYNHNKLDIIFNTHDQRLKQIKTLFQNMMIKRDLLKFQDDLTVIQINFQNNVIELLLKKQIC